jgi:hypothetical protein
MMTIRTRTTMMTMITRMKRRKTTEKRRRRMETMRMEEVVVGVMMRTPGRTLRWKRRLEMERAAVETSPLK